MKPLPVNTVGMIVLTPSHLRGEIVVKDYIQENGPLPLRWLNLSGGFAVGAEDVVVLDAPGITINPGNPF